MPSQAPEESRQELQLLFTAASSSTAPVFREIPASGLKQPPSTWVRRFQSDGQTVRPATGEKEKQKQIFIPSASHRRKEGELGARDLQT